jgi:ParB family chromosome partitioning protein
MGSDVVKATGAERRSDMLWFLPESLVVVRDPSHELYDKRALLFDKTPLGPKEENLVLSIMEEGVLAPVIVRKNGEIKKGEPVMEVVFGRRRVLAALEANRRLKKFRREPVGVPARLMRVGGHEAFGLVITENEIRRGNDAIARAELLEKYLALGGTEKKAAIKFGCTEQTIRNLKALNDCSEKVKDAVREKVIPLGRAQDLSTMPRAEQDRALVEMIATGATKGKKAEAATTKLRAGRGKTRERKAVMRQRKEIVALLDGVHALKGFDSKTVAATLRWVIGDDAALSEYEDVENVRGRL